MNKFKNALIKHRAKIIIIAVAAVALTVAWHYGGVYQDSSGAAPPTQASDSIAAAQLETNDSTDVANATEVTDVTNASRTMFMNLETCQWDNRLLE